jgi:hypothetical protein
MKKMNDKLTFIDASRIQDYQVCPRMYLYKHILGWQLDILKDINLVFGQAWHFGMASLLGGRHPNGIPEVMGNNYGIVYPSPEHAMVAFNSYYRKFYGEDTDLQNFPKNPGVALNAYISYAADYSEQDRDLIVLHTEVRDSIDLGWGIPIAFRIDAVLQDKQGILIQEHKTSSMLFSNWADQWHEKPQVYIYMAASKAFYGEKVNRMVINGSFFRKGTAKQSETGNVEHLRLPIIKDDDGIEAGLDNLKVWVDSIQEDYEGMRQTKDIKVLLAFPKAGTSCIQYMRPCTYQAYCQAFKNPCLEDCPSGMKIKFWDPRVEDDE